MRSLASRRPVGYWYMLMLLLLWCNVLFSTAIRDGMHHTFVVPLLELVLVITEAIVLLVFVPGLLLLGRLCWLRLSSAQEEAHEITWGFDLMMIEIAAFVLWNMSPTQNLIELFLVVGLLWCLRGRIEQIRLLWVLGGLCWMWSLLIVFWLPQALWIFTWSASMALTTWAALLMVGGRLCWEWLHDKNQGHASQITDPAAQKQTEPLRLLPPHE